MRVTIGGKTLVAASGSPSVSPRLTASFALRTASSMITLPAVPATMSSAPSIGTSRGIRLENVREKREMATFRTSCPKTGLLSRNRCQLNMPIFGQLVRKVAISRFSRTFSTLIQSGVPMLGALDIVAGTAGNVVIEDAVLKAKDAVSRGETLGEPLAATKVFPPMVTRMIAIGEKTGALEKLLAKISEFYDAEVKAAVKALTSLIEPLMIGIMGLLVGGIVLAIFMPIIKLQQQLGGGS